MRQLASLLLACSVSVTAVAQIRVPNIPLPRDLPLPNIDRLLRGEAPLSTSLNNVRRDVPFLDKLAPKFQSMAKLQTARGTFMLPPGHWTVDLDSFCVRPGTRGPQPTDGRGFLPAPIAGRHAAIIEHMLGQYGRLTDIPQRDMQVLIWSVMSRVKIHNLDPKQRALAARVLTPAQIVALDSGAIDIIPPQQRRQIFSKLPREVQQVAEAEQRVRDVLHRANYTYEELERAAILQGPPEKPAKIIPTSRWAVHPDGFLMRLKPHSIYLTTVEIARPHRYQIRRDQLGRIVSIDFGDGRRTETEYDDAIPAFTPPNKSPLVGYALKSVRLIRRGAGGRPEEVVVRNKGWTFIMKPNVRVAPKRGVMLASWQPGIMDRFSDWLERYQEFQEEYGDRAEYYRDLWEDVTDPPPSVEETLRDLEDMEHYRDGIDAALRGDIGDRLEWLIDHQERMNNALERATLLLDRLPDRSDAESDFEYHPPRDIAVPGSRGEQRGGISSRIH